MKPLLLLTLFSVNICSLQAGSVLAIEYDPAHTLDVHRLIRKHRIFEPKIVTIQRPGMRPVIHPVPPVVVTNSLPSGRIQLTVRPGVLPEPR